MTDKQIDIVAHSLGINYYNAKVSNIKKYKFLPEEFYRNYYNYGEFTDDMKELEQNGFIKKFTSLNLTCFCITEKGINEFKTIFLRNVTATYVPLSKSKERYLQFLHSDSCETFAEYYGIHTPKREYNSNNGLMRFISTKYPDVKGEYKKTVKDAKESYKIKLKEYKENITSALYIS